MSLIKFDMTTLAQMASVITTESVGALESMSRVHVSRMNVAKPTRASRL